MKYEELTEVKEMLEANGIKYREVRINGGILLYVNGLMQIQKPNKEQQNRFWPDVRVSKHTGEKGYYVRACGVIYEHQRLDGIMNLIETFC